MVIVLIDFQMLNQSSWCNPLLVSNIFDMLWNSILFRIFFLHSLVALFYSFHFLSCLLEQGSCSDTKCCPTVTPWTAAHQAPLSFTVSQSLPKSMSTESVVLSSRAVLVSYNELGNVPSSSTFCMSL